MTPIPLDRARVALILATYVRGVSDGFDRADFAAGHVPPHLAADELDAWWSSHTLAASRPVRAVVERLVELTRSQSLALPSVLAWAYWRGVREGFAGADDVAARHVQHAAACGRLTPPTMRDLLEAEAATFSSGAADAWQGYAAAARVAFARATEPTGRASFTPNAGSSRG